MAKAAWLGLVLAAGVGSFARAETNVVAVAQDEDRLAARALAVENDRLRGEVAGLMEKVGELTVSLAEAMAELDLARAREERVGAGTPRRVDAGVRVTEVRVLDVNPVLRMAVVDAGREAGLVPGLVFAVMRDGRVVARLRVVDVRERIAGAALEEGASAALQRGDRAVLAR